MELPKFHETFIPILSILSNGKTFGRSELKTQVRDKFYANLPKPLLEIKTASGDILILNRIGWGLGYLKQAKLIEQPGRAKFKISKKGLGILKKGKLSLAELTKDPDYQEYEKSKLQDKKNEKLLKHNNASPQDQIDSGLATIDRLVKNELLEKLKTIDPYYFEKVVLKLLKQMGYGEWETTPKSGDKGIDGIINQDALGVEKIYIQAKRYNENKVREPEIRNFIGAMTGGTTKGIFVTTSSFDDSATKKSKQAPHLTIILIDGEKLVDLMHSYCVGLQVTNTYEVKAVDEDFFEEN